MSQGAGCCPKGLVGWVKNTQQRVKDMPALTLNTSISSSMSSSVSMSSRGSTMTFCTVPRSARHHSAQVLSATPGTHALPVYEAGLCWGCGKEGSPRLIPISLLLWQVAMSGVECARSVNQLCLDSARERSEQHGDMHQGKRRTKMDHGGSGMHIKSRGSTGLDDSAPRKGTEI